MGTHRREAEHLLYSVRSEYGEGFGKGLWALGAAEAARVTWERDLSEVQFPRPRAPRLYAVGSYVGAGDHRGHRWYRGV